METMILSPLRTQRAASLRDMAHRMGSSHSAVHKIEQSKNPGVITLYRYAKALDVPLEEVIEKYVALYEKGLQTP